MSNFDSGEYIVYIGDTILPRYEEHFKFKSLLTKNKIYKICYKYSGQTINGYWTFHLIDDRNEIGGYELLPNKIVSLNEYRLNKLNQLVNIDNLDHLPN